MVIREERSTDFSSVHRVHEIAFDSSDEPFLVELLRSQGKAVISLVAEKAGVIVGHVMFSQVTIEPMNPQWNVVGLAPVGVLPHYRRLGIGSQLIRRGLALCKDACYAAVVVLGNPTYYSRFGFLRAKDLGLQNEYGETDAFMVLEFSPGVLKDFTGMVKYPPEFREASC